MVSIDLWCAVIIITAVSIGMTSIFISTILIYYRRKRRLTLEKRVSIGKYEKKYIKLIRSMDDAVFIVDIDKRLLLWNNKFLLCFDIDTKIEKGIKLSDIIDYEDFDSIGKYIDNVVEKTVSQSTEIHHISEGEKKWFGISFIPQLNEGKKTISILCIAHDLTKRRNLQIKIEDMVSTLKSQQALLKDLSSKMIRVQEEERKSLSRNLHDEIGQTLTAININLEIFNQAVSLSKLDLSQRILDCKKLVVKTIQNVQWFAHDLRPTLLDELGLESSILSYARKFSDRTGIKIDITKSQENHKFADDVEIVLYRIFQEGLNNIAKHAQAKNVRVELETHENTIVLSIADDGVGFNIKGLENKAVGKGGLGINGMRERVKLIEGKLSLTSKQKQGTTIYVEAPIGEA